jgi:hypothetical protein
MPGDYDIRVRVVAPGSVEDLLADAPRGSRARTYPTVRQTQRAGLFALLRLTQLIQTRQSKHRAAYVSLEFGEEVRRWIAEDAKLRDAFGANNWPRLNKERLADARKSVVKSLARRIRFPLSEVSRQLNGRLRKATFVVWWADRDKKLFPGIFCEEMETAFAAMLVSRVASPEGLAVCQRCGKRFVRKKRIQRYCTLRCGNAARKSRQRASGRSG